MNSLFYVIIFCAFGMAISSCGNNTQKANADQPVDTVPVADTIVAEKTTVAETGSPYDKVTRWEISITSVSTIIEECSEAEAERINAGGDEEEWAEFDDVEGKWIKHGYTDVVTGKKVITDPEYVARLNEMMQQKMYSNYASDVKISGNTAKAKWYGGNRGGGVGEDFPSGIADYILN